MVGSAAKRESELTLFGRFSSALSHVVRGDLSVITNEVSYLATMMPSAELDRVKNRCSQMASTVSKIAGLQSETIMSPVSAKDTARIFGSAPLTDAVDSVVYLDRLKIERLASIVRQLVPSNTEGWSGHLQPGALMLSLQSAASHDRVVRYFSWSSFASSELGERSVIDGVVADLIMRAHGWTILIEVKNNSAQFSLSVPFKSNEGQACERVCA